MCLRLSLRRPIHALYASSTACRDRSHQATYNLWQKSLGQRVYEQISKAQACVQWRYYIGGTSQQLKVHVKRFYVVCAEDLLHA
jgi:hypothetical protein